MPEILRNAFIPSLVIVGLVICVIGAFMIIGYCERRKRRHANDRKCGCGNTNVRHRHLRAFDPRENPGSHRMICQAQTFCIDPPTVCQSKDKWVEGLKGTQRKKFGWFKRHFHPDECGEYLPEEIVGTYGVVLGNHLTTKVKPELTHRHRAPEVFVPKPPAAKADESAETVEPGESHPATA